MQAAAIRRISGEGPFAFIHPAHSSAAWAHTDDPRDPVDVTGRGCCPSPSGSPVSSAPMAGRSLAPLGDPAPTAGPFDVAHDGASGKASHSRADLLGTRIIRLQY